MRATIKDIAELANVSISTVSRALNDNPRVKSVTKTKIKDIAKSLNFEFNAGARSLSSNITGNIAVVYDSHIDGFEVSLYINQLFLEVRHILEQMDMDAILLTGYDIVTGASNIDRMVRKQKVDGFLIVHDSITNEDYRNIQSAGLPIVQLHMIPRKDISVRFDSFYSDNFKGGQMATKHLIDIGCKKILTVLPFAEDSVEYSQRVLGYKQALDNNDLIFDEDLVVSVECSYFAGYNLFNTIPDRLEGVDGIFFQADIQAFGFLTAARERGIDIPGELKIIGYDDAPMCETVIPHLSSVHQPRKELAEMACKKVVDLIHNNENHKPECKFILPTLVLRESC